MNNNEENSNAIGYLVERYAWVDQRLEQLYLQDQDRYQEDSLLDDEEIAEDDEDNEMDNFHLNAYDHGEGDDDFRVICRRLFPYNDDDSEETEADILSEMSVDFDDLCYEGHEAEVEEAQEILQLPEGPQLIRANTQFQINGVTVYNGNPDGSHLFGDQRDDLELIA
jgi:hypothetical protein